MSRGHLQRLCQLGQADAKLVCLVAYVAQLDHERLAAEALFGERDVIVGGSSDVRSLAHRGSSCLWWRSIPAAGDIAA